MYQKEPFPHILKKLVTLVSSVCGSAPIDRGSARHSTCNLLLKRLENDPFFLKNIVTEDEKWIVGFLVRCSSCSKSKAFLLLF